MNSNGLRSHVAVFAAAAAALLLACGGDGGSVAPPPPGDGRDTTPPRAVSSLVALYDADQQELVLRWYAPRDDALHRRVDHYEIRYTTLFPFDWEQATVAAGPPAPLDPGALQQFVLARPARSIDLYASVRALDAAGNISPVGTVAHVRIPGVRLRVACADALTGAPIAGLAAIFQTDSGQDIQVTDADGVAEILDLHGGTVGIALTPGAATTACHVFHETYVIDADTTLQVPMIPFQQPDSGLYTSILALLKDALFSPGGTRTIKRWDAYPVTFYARDFVNGYGLDYRALLQQAAERWNTRLGIPHFASTTSDPATGVLVEFLPRSTMGSVNGVTDYSLDGNGYPVHDRIRIVDDITDGQKLYEIFMHELGHTIPLGHLSAGFIMYASQPLPGDITDDEVKIVKLLLALPNGTGLDAYDSSPPAR